MPELDQELLRQAIEAIERASFATSGSERHRLLDEALRLYRLARSGGYPLIEDDLDGER